MEESTVAAATATATPAAAAAAISPIPAPAAAPVVESTSLYVGNVRALAGRLLLLLTLVPLKLRYVTTIMLLPADNPIASLLHPLARAQGTVQVCWYVIYVTGCVVGRSLIRAFCLLFHPRCVPPPPN